MSNLSSLTWYSRFIDETPGDSVIGGPARQVEGACWSRVLPTPSPNPSLQLWSEEMANSLSITKSDLEIFFSFTSGASGTSHKENYDVYIVGLLGNTVYKIEDKYFEVEKGDVLTIPKNTIHKSIALTPRIILSYAVY